MRVSPRELQAVRRSGMLTRYALLGPVAYVLVDLPAEGADGTGLEQACVTDHHGIVLRGTFRAHHDDGRVDAFDAGTVFYVPVGPPAHHFSWTSGTIVGGFAPIAPETQVDEATLRDQGFEIVRRAARAPAPPSSVALAGSVEPFRRAGAIDVEGSVMGRWLFMRSIFGPQSGLSSGRCDLPHWGLVIRGDLAIHAGDAVELVSAGDVFIVEPGHRFEVPDGATVLDYTPLDALQPGTRTATWRRAAIGKALDRITPGQVASAVGARAERAIDHRPVPLALRLRPASA